MEIVARPFLFLWRPLHQDCMYRKIILHYDRSQVQRTKKMFTSSSFSKFSKYVANLHLLHSLSPSNMRVHFSSTHTGKHIQVWVLLTPETQLLLPWSCSVDFWEQIWTHFVWTPRQLLLLLSFLIAECICLALDWPHPQSLQSCWNKSRACSHRPAKVILEISFWSTHSPMLCFSQSVFVFLLTVS